MATASLRKKCFVASCEAWAAYEVGRREKYAVCAMHGKAYKKSTKNYHLTNKDGRGRHEFNDKVYQECPTYLKTLWDADGSYLRKVLHDHSHNYAGRVEIRMRAKHVADFFEQGFNDNHMHWCFEIASKVPPNYTGHHLVDVALACIAGEVGLTHNGRHLTDQIVQKVIDELNANATSGNGFAIEDGY